MEQNRFEQNKTLFVIGMITMIIGLSLFAFSIYILPVLIWNWKYNIPDFIIMWREDIRAYYETSDANAGLILFLLLITPAFIAGLISHFISNAMDKHLYGIAKEEPPPTSTTSRREDVKESLSFSGKVILLLILVVLIVWVVEWILAPL